MLKDNRQRTGVNRYLIEDIGVIAIGLLPFRGKEMLLAESAFMSNEGTPYRETSLCGKTYGDTAFLRSAAAQENGSTQGESTQSVSTQSVLHGHLFFNTA